MPDLMQAVAVALAAFLAAGLTMYSGFGLGTLMLPVFALFLPVEMAVVATALVHGANNVFKVTLLGRRADREVVLKFGLPAVLAAVLGAMLLGWFAGADSSISAAPTVSVALTTGMLGNPHPLAVGSFRDAADDGCRFPMPGEGGQNLFRLLRIHDYDHANPAVEASVHFRRRHARVLEPGENR